MCRQKQDRRDCVGGIRDKGSQRAATAFAFVSIKERARSLRLSQRLCLKGNVCRFNYVDFIKGARVLDKLFWLWIFEENHIAWRCPDFLPDNNDHCH